MVKGSILIIPKNNLSKSNFFDSDVVNNDIKIMTTFFLIDKWEERYIKQKSISFCFDFLS